MKKAIITGISGQDGAWLAKCLLNNNYKVYGGVRRISSRDYNRLEQLKIKDRVELIELDLLDYSNIFNIVKEIKPDEFYNLAAQSFVGTSFKQPISTYQVDGLSVGYILDVLKTVKPDTKFYQASSSEMYGKVDPECVPLDERCPFHPRSPYGVAKLFAHWATVNYRESYNMFCCSGILFNHESELRGPEFVTRKISMHVASKDYHDIIMGPKLDPLELGNLDAVRDWGYAKEYCEGMWQMMQQTKPDTYVLATGKAKTVRQFVEAAFSFINRQIIWSGEAENEEGYDAKTGELLVKVNPKFYRPAEVDLLLGCAAKAKKAFGWEAQTDVDKLAEIMVKNDIDRLNQSRR